MARTIAEIKKEMTDAFLADETLRLKYGFDPTKTFNEQFSKVSLESIIFYIVAASIWVLEVLFDKHTEEVRDTIDRRAHTLRWYRDKAFAFQYGCDLREDIAEYDNSGLTEEQIEASKIITKCSCESVEAVYPTIQVKACTANGKMNNDQYSAFKSYMEELADAGVKLSIFAMDPDKLGLSLTIMYDPLLINERGALYNDGVEKIVEKYIEEYLSNLDYNGDFYPNMLEKYLMNCVGVKVANVTSAWLKPENGSIQNITGLIKQTPVSGAFTFDNSINPSLAITYIPFSNGTAV